MDVFDLETALVSRISALPEARNVPVLSTGEAVDFTAGVDNALAVKVAIGSLSVGGQVQTQARQYAEFSVTVYRRLAAGRRQSQQALFSAAVSALVGWQPVPGRECRLADGPPPHDEDGVAGVSFAVAIPVFYS
jgi:hypothetical protein